MFLQYFFFDALFLSILYVVLIIFLPSKIYKSFFNFFHLFYIFFHVYILITSFVFLQLVLFSNKLNIIISIRYILCHIIVGFFVYKFFFCFVNRKVSLKIGLSNLLVIKFFIFLWLKFSVWFLVLFNRIFLKNLLLFNFLKTILFQIVVIS